MSNSSYKITRANHGNIISGILSVAALAGQFVNVKDSTLAAGYTSLHQNPALELSTGRGAFVLVRDVIAGPRSLDSLIFADDDILSPVIVGGAVSAREILEGEFEGEDYLTLAGAQAIADTTPLRSILTTLSGKLALHTGDQIEVTVTGRNGAGAATVAGTRVGDKVRSVYNETDNADVTSSFEATVTVAGQVQQSAATDFSAKKLRYIVETPENLQAPLFRLISFLAPEDATNNTFRIAIEKI